MAVPRAIGRAAPDLPPRRAATVPRAWHRSEPPLSPAPGAAPAPVWHHPSPSRCREPPPSAGRRHSHHFRDQDPRPFASSNACVAVDASAINDQLPASARHTRRSSSIAAMCRPITWPNASEISGSVGIATVVDVEYVDNLVGLVDAVPDAVHASPCPPLPTERCAKRAAYPARVLGQRAEHELDACCCGGLGQLFRQLPGGGAGDDDPETHSAAWVPDLASSKARTCASSSTSPLAMSCSERDRRCCESASLRSSSVASIDSRSSAAMRTT